jgi:hypothetical protein
MFTLLYLQTNVHYTWQQQCAPHGTSMQRIAAAAPHAQSSINLLHGALQPGHSNQ